MGFVGRAYELAQLRAWVLEEHSQLVAVLGMGGIGKTSLISMLARDVMADFERVYWRSLRDAPPVSEWLAGAIGFLSDHKLVPPVAESEWMTALLRLLRASRCLLVLDNFEALFEPGQSEGRYRAGMEEYGRILQAVGETSHQSCLMLTSREAPPELAVLGSRLRVLELHGLGVDESQALLASKELTADAQTWVGLVDHYGGNGLALKIVGETIQQVFNGDVAAFLRDATVSNWAVYGGIRRLLVAHVERLSPGERDVLTRLAVQREPIGMAELARDMAPSAGRSVVIDSIEMLRRRSLVERAERGERGERGASFTLQTVVLEHVTNELVDVAVHEIEQGGLRFLVRHALMKALSKDYVRRTQERLIIRPILDALVAAYGSPRAVEQRLIELVGELRLRPRADHGYAPGNMLNLLRLLRGDLRGTDFSGLHIREAFLQETDMQDGSLAGAELSAVVLADAFSWPACVALSGDGQYVAAGTSMGEVYIWRLADRALVLRLKAHDGMTLSVALSDSGDRLASGSDDGRMRLWSAHTGELLSTFQGHLGGALSVALSGNGLVVASSDAAGSINVWNANSAIRLASIPGSGEAIWAMAFDATGKMFATASGSKVQVWEAQSCRLAATLGGHQGGNFSVAISADGQVVAAGSFDGNARVWRVASGQLVATLPGHEGGAWSVALDTHGQTLITASFDGTIRAWDTVDGQLTAIMRGHTGGVRGVAVTRDGRTIASASYDGTVRLWLADGRLLGELRGFTSGMRAVALKEDAKLCATASFDRGVRVWDVDQGRLVSTLTGHTGGVWAVAMSADGQLIASGGDDGTVRLWGSPAGESLAVLHGHTSAIWSVAVSPPGDKVLSGSLDGTARLWSAPLGEELAVLDAKTGPIWAVAISRDGLTCASSGHTGVITIWDARSLSLVRTFQAHLSPVFGLAFSGDARLLASASFDATVRLWDTRSGECLGDLRGHTGGVWSVAVSQNGDRVGTAGFDGTVRLWDTRTLRMMSALRGHVGGVWSVAFDQSGRVLASAGVDGSTVVWNVQESAPLVTLRRDRLYERLDVTRLTGITEAQAGALVALGAVDHSPESGAGSRLDSRASRFSEL
jgi:WD40 repeat protein